MSIIRYVLNFGLYKVNELQNAGEYVTSYFFSKTIRRRSMVIATICMHLEQIWSSVQFVLEYRNILYSAVKNFNSKLLDDNTYIVQFIIQSTGVADRFTVLVPPP